MSNEHKVKTLIVGKSLTDGIINESLSSANNNSMMRSVNDFFCYSLIAFYG
jgi:hypothetical protein